MASDIQVIRQLLLDLLTEYQGIEKPANPELLKLHIEAYEDRFEALIQEQVKEAYDRGYADKAIKADKFLAEQVRLARIDEVERFLVEPGEVIPYNNNTFADGFRYVVEKLQARLEELRGEK